MRPPVRELRACNAMDAAGIAKLAGKVGHHGIEGDGRERCGRCVIGVDVGMGVLRHDGASLMAGVMELWLAYAI